MKKKALSLALVLAMTASLTACGGNNDTTSDSAEVPGSTQTAETSDGAAEGEIYEVVMQYPTLGETPKDLQLVEDKVNERTEKEIGVHVTFYPVSAFDLNSTSNMMVSSGEKLDLMLSLFENGVSSYVNKGILIELDDLVEQYGQDIIAAEGLAMSGGYFDGKLYAVPTEEKMGRVKAFVAREDLLEKYNIEYDANHLYTPDELSDIFATVQAGEGAGFYCVAANPSDDPLWTMFSANDFCGASMASGVVPDFGQGSEIINYYATDEFKQLTETFRDWYNNGYLAPDCNTVTDSTLTLTEGGNYLGFFENAESDMVSVQSYNINDYIGTGIVPLYTCEPAAMTQYYQISQWAIPITCDNPEKTMQWLNMLYSDQEMINLCYYGIEGTHWEFVDGSDCIIDYTEGLDATNTGYPALLGVFGDKSQNYVMPPRDETYYQQLKDFNSSITPEHTSKILGYCFNSDPVKTQYAALTDVVKQYAVTLGLGVVDPETTIPEFLDALSAAGIDEVIAENQSQLNAWMAEQQ